jgi:hypothetical protein
MWRRRRVRPQVDQLFVSADELRRASGEVAEHTAVVGRIFSTGDRCDGYYDSDEWSGPGRDLRPFFWWACLSCDSDGSLHTSFEAAADEARAHTPDVREGQLPIVLPGNPAPDDEGA